MYNAIAAQTSTSAEAVNVLFFKISYLNVISFKVDLFILSRCHTCEATEVF